MRRQGLRAGEDTTGVQTLDTVGPNKAEHAGLCSSQSARARDCALSLAAASFPSEAAPQLLQSRHSRPTDVTPAHVTMGPSESVRQRTLWCNRAGLACAFVSKHSVRLCASWWGGGNAGGSSWLTFVCVTSAQRRGIHSYRWSGNSAGEAAEQKQGGGGDCCSQSGALFVALSRNRFRGRAQSLARRRSAPRCFGEHSRTLPNSSQCHTLAVGEQKPAFKV